MANRLTSWFTATRITKLWYLPILALGMILMYVRLLVLAYILPVEQYAAYSVGILVSSSFLMLACFGLHAVLQRELPVLCLHGKARKGMMLVIQCITVATLSSLVLIAFILALEINVADVPSHTLAVGLVHGLSQQYFLVATTESRSRGDPLKYSTDNLIRSVLVLAGCFLIATFSHNAMQVLITETLLSLLVSLNLLRQQLGNVRLWSARAVMLATRQLSAISWSPALTLMILGITAFLMLNLDRWFGAYLLATEQFAHYAFAWTLLMAAQSAQVMLNAALYPMIARRLASITPGAAFRLTIYASFASFLLGSISAVVVWIALQHYIPHWFPAYSSSLVLMPIFMGVAVLRFSDYWSTYLVIAKREKSLVVINSLVIVACPALWWIVHSPDATKPELLHPAWLAAYLQLVCYIATMFAAYRSASAIEKTHSPPTVPN